jgi:putative heme-binding domain-containing protein
MVALDATQSADKLVRVLAQTKDPAEGALLVQAFLASQQGPVQLAGKLAGVTLDQGVAEESVKRVNASGQAMPGLVSAIRRAGGLPDGERMVSPQQIASLANQVLRSGDPHRGQAIYQRKELNCATCHVIRGVGGRVGPELTTIGTSAPVDYLVESLLLPSAKVKENYHSLVIVTDEGKVVTGIPEQQSETEITLRLADNSTVSIPKGRVDETKTGGSLMPTDVVDTLPTGELVDLVRYLAELGKPGPFGPAEEKSARQWRILGPVSPAEGEAAQKAFLSGQFDAARWRESLTTNDAWVYVRELALTPDQPLFLGTTTIDVRQPGKVRLTLRPGPKGAYWLDGKPLEVKTTGDEEAAADVDLTAGQHTLFVRVDLSKVPNILRLRAYGLDEKVDFDLERPR